MVHPVTYGRTERMNFSRIDEVVAPPNLIAVQKNSYDWFIEDGLQEVFENISPIVDHMDKYVLEFVGYRFDEEPKYTVAEAKERETTYAVPLRVKVRLINKETGEAKEQEIFMGDFPLMTDSGTFVINGAERVIVSQLVRSPGIYFGMERDKSGKELYSSTMIPNRGAWLEFEMDSNDTFYIRIDRTRKLPATVFLRALGFSTNEQITSLFGEESLLTSTFEKDSTTNYEEGLLEVYKRLRPGEPPSVESAQTLLHNLFFDNRRYDLARVGRYKYNKKCLFVNRIVGRTAAENIVCPFTGEMFAAEGDTITKEIALELDRSAVNMVKIRLDDGKELLWISERDGWRHLYLIDGTSGQVKRQVTKGEWVLRQVDYVDETNRVVYFTASGFNKGEDPYNLHYCRINLDGTGFTDMTPENGNHRVTFSADRSYFTDVYSRPDLPPVSQLKRTSDVSVVAGLQRCDVSALQAEGWQMPEVFCAKGRDGQTDIWGNIYRPMHFDASKSYPVVEFIYAGPHDSHVDKDFKPAHHLVSKLVELGFIVVSIDGMGTSNRSKAFHDVCWKNLKDAGFPDRIAWMKAAGAKYKYMDLNRVGIYGWSAGGQNAMAALLFHNDFYKVAVALCGCHDNRMDKIWWNEQWMGYPIDASYSTSSNVDNAYRLKGKLLLINGELDDNVDPASTLQVVSALMKANKNFEQLYLPGKTHSLGGPFEMHKMHDFFVKNLLGQEPPEWE